MLVAFGLIRNLQNQFWKTNTYNNNTNLNASYLCHTITRIL